MDEIIKLDVGGHLYTTTRSTLTRYPDSMLGAMFSGRMPSTRDPNGAYIIDGDGPIFRYILSFLRRGKLNLPTDFKDWDMLRSEADFYHIELKDAVTKTTENASMEFIEIIHMGNKYTYRGNPETLKQLPILLGFLNNYNHQHSSRMKDAIDIVFSGATYTQTWCNILEGVERDGLFTLNPWHGDLAHRAQHDFNKLWTGIFHEISKLGFELKTSSSAFRNNDQELRWTFARKIC